MIEILLIDSGQRQPLPAACLAGDPEIQTLAAKCGKLWLIGNKPAFCLSDDNTAPSRDFTFGEWICYQTNITLIIYKAGIPATEKNNLSYFLSESISLQYFCTWVWSILKFNTQVLSFKILCSYARKQPQTCSSSSTTMFETMFHHNDEPISNLQ